MISCEENRERWKTFSHKVPPETHQHIFTSLCGKNSTMEKFFHRKTEIFWVFIGYIERRKISFMHLPLLAQGKHQKTWGYPHVNRIEFWFRIWDLDMFSLTSLWCFRQVAKKMIFRLFVWNIKKNHDRWNSNSMDFFYCCKNKKLLE